MNKDINNKKNSGEINNVDLELRSFYISALKHLEEGRLEDAYRDFSRSGSAYGCAYCKFLEGSLEEAHALVKDLRGSSPAADWLIFLIDLIKGEKNEKQ